MTQLLIDRATLEQLVAALEKHHKQETRYSDNKRRANATCAHFTVNPLQELAEQAYMLTHGKETIEAIASGRAALAGAKPAKPIAFGRLVDGDIADVICPETHEYYEGDYTVPLYAAPLAASTSAKTLKELAAKGCGKCFYQDCDFPNCCKRKDTQ